MLIIQNFQFDSQIIQKIENTFLVTWKVQCIYKISMSINKEIQFYHTSFYFSSSLYLQDDFWKNTNIVGLTNAAAAENAPRKVFWIVVFLLFFGWFVTRLCIYLGNYFIFYRTVMGLYDLFLGLYDTDTAIKINGTSYVWILI